MQKHFYTNGVIDRKFADDDVIPEGFHLGRTNGCGAFTKDRFAINNGSQCRFIKNGEPIPDGWVKGQLKFTEEHKQKISQKMKQHKRTAEHCKNISKSHHTSSYTNKIKSTLLAKYGVDNAFKAEEVKAKCNTPEVIKKRFNTMKQNKTIAKSRDEDNYYNYLIEKYGIDDVERNYRESRYPFACDFYIKSKDLFIEFQGTWTHGEHPFDSNCEEDVKKLNEWKEKALTSAYYRNAVENWSIRDVKKLQTAIDNKLNYMFIYPSVVISNMEV